jgi:hypothetical protein
MTFEALMGMVGGAVGIIGGTVGIITAIRTKRREDWKEIEEQNDYSFLASFMQKQLDVGPRAGQIFTELDIGSAMWKRAEKMVERGILERGPQGRGYRIRGFESLKAAPFRREPEKKLPEIDIDRRRT